MNACPVIGYTYASPDDEDDCASLLPVLALDYVPALFGDMPVLLTPEFADEVLKLKKAAK